MQTTTEDTVETVLRWSDVDGPIEVATSKGTQAEERGEARITTRDVQLLAALAVARYLSLDQLQRLFASRGKARRTERRLRILAGASREMGTVDPLVERLQYRSEVGRRVTVFGLTEAGYRVVEHHGRRALPRFSTRVGAQYMEHCISLNELFVQLALPTLSRLGSVLSVPFEWTPTETTRLPWSQYEAKEGKRRARVIVPDAILTFPLARRRLFLECEMGTHPISSSDGDRAGATLAKASSYDEFLSGLREGSARETFYAKVFPDGYSAEVLFLVSSPSRRDSVNRALAQWAKGRGRSGARCRAVVLEELVAELSTFPTSETASAEIRVSAPPRVQECIRGEESETLKRFFNESLRRMRPELQADPDGSLAALAKATKGVLVKLTGTREEAGD